MIKFRYANFVSTNPPMCPRPPVHSIIDQSKFVTHSSFKHRQKKWDSCQEKASKQNDHMAVPIEFLVSTREKLLYWINMDVSEDYD
uniref:Uncharacterized protein n=1 Tax=Globodera rostochiensis TaxID=31243 RepID=A0A914GSN8_GLORO